MCVFFFFFFFFFLFVFLTFARSFSRLVFNNTALFNRIRFTPIISVLFAQKKIILCGTIKATWPPTTLSFEKNAQTIQQLSNINVRWWDIRCDPKSLTHLCLASHKRDTGKQCRPRSDAAERGVWSRSTLLAFNTGISIKHGKTKNNQTSLLLEMDRSRELR